jgi:hypothetical protein
MIVVTRNPAANLRQVKAEVEGPAPWDVAMVSARLMRRGAEVRVVDQNAEKLAHRMVRRELKLWRPDLVLLYAGGSRVSNDPIPDARPLVSLLAGWGWPGPVLAFGPLAARYGHELLKTAPRLDGVLTADVPMAFAQEFDPAIPGIARLEGGEFLSTPPLADEDDARVLPAWHLLPLDSYAEFSPGGQRTAFVGERQGDDADVIAEVRHAVRRAGARYLVFEERDFGADHEFSNAVARQMFGAAPGVPWTCRVRADHITPSFVLTLARGGCAEVLVVPPVPDEVPGQTPMDDPSRPRFEGAVEAVRVTGMSVAVKHILGRPGQTRAMLSAWHRWFHDRRIAVKPQVLRQHAGDRGLGQPDLAEARRMAGCWDNELSAGDVERAVKLLLGGQPQAAHA